MLTRRVEAKIVPFREDLYRRPPCAAPAFARGEPLFGTLAWGQADAIARMVQISAFGEGKLTYMDGGARANFYLVDSAGSRRVLAAGKKWVTSEEKDSIDEAFQASRLLKEIDSSQSPVREDIFRVRRDDGSYISVFEADYVQIDNDVRAEREEGTFYFGPLPELFELYPRHVYSKKAIGAFVDLLLDDYRKLNGFFPDFNLGAKDIVVNQTGRRPSETYAFTFLWCKGLQETLPEKMAGFLRDKLVFDEALCPVCEKGAGPEDIERLIDAKVAEFRRSGRA